MISTGCLSSLLLRGTTGYLQLNLMVLQGFSHLNDSVKLGLFWDTFSTII